MGTQFRKKGSEVNFEELGGYSSSLSESVLSLIDDRENKMHNGYITSGRDGIKYHLKESISIKENSILVQHLRIKVIFILILLYLGL